MLNRLSDRAPLFACNVYAWVNSSKFRGFWILRGLSIAAFYPAWRKPAQTQTVIRPPPDENDVDIDCETGCASNENAYVNWGGYDVNLCSNFFNSGFSNSKKAAILVHELTHAYADTDDYCYYPNDLSNQPWNLLFETPTLRENADSYEQFLLEFYP